VDGIEDWGGQGRPGVATGGHTQLPALGGSENRKQPSSRKRTHTCASNTREALVNGESASSGTAFSTAAKVSSSGTTSVCSVKLYLRRDSHAPATRGPQTVQRPRTRLREPHRRWGMRYLAAQRPKFPTLRP
jgi:hypothetical protein